MLISSPWIPFLILPSQMSPKHTPHAATALGTCFLSNFPHIACACFFCWFFKPFHFLTQASECRCLLLYIIFVPFILFCHHAFYSFHHSFGFHVIAADEALVHTYRCFAKHFPSEVYPCGHVKWSVVYQPMYSKSFVGSARSIYKFRAETSASEQAHSASSECCSLVFKLCWCRFDHFCILVCTKLHLVKWS